MVGTVVATTVVFQAVRVMTDNLGARSNDANNRSGQLPSTTTIARPTGSSSSAQATTVPATVEATTTTETEPTTASSQPEPVIVGPTDPSTGDTRSTTPLTTPRGQASNPPATKPPAVTPTPAPPPNTPAPPPPSPAADPPTAAATTTTRPVIPATCEAKVLSAGANKVSVNRCTEASPPYHVYAAVLRVVPVVPYAFQVVSPGPAAEVRFNGPTNWLCTAGATDAGDWDAHCVQV